MDMLYEFRRVFRQYRLHHSRAYAMQAARNIVIHGMPF